MEIAGLPLHVLVVHATVVFTPLAALAAVVFAVVPKWRYLSRWPTAILAVTAFGAVWVARLSGTSFKNELDPQIQELIQTHQDRGMQLSLLMILFLVVAAVAVWTLPGDSGFASGSGARESRVVALDKVMPAALVVSALLVLVWVILTGDAGSRAVWEDVI
jgi:hypothetical protein